MYNPSYLQLLDHPHRILIIGGSGCGKTNALLNLKRHKPDTDKICLYAKDPYEAKYQLLINKRERVSLKHYKNYKAFIECSNDMDDIYENIDKCNLNKEYKICIAFDNMIADKFNNKKKSINNNRIVY